MSKEVKNEVNMEQFFEAIEQLATQNLLSIEEIVEIISDSVKKSFHSKFDPDADLDFTLDFDKKEIKLINNTKYVVDEEVADEYKAVEISLKDAKKIKKTAKDGDIISDEVDFLSYSKNIAGRIKQMIVQSVREKKKAAVYSKHKGLKGEMVTAVVTSSSTTHAILVLEDQTIAFMPSKFKNPNIKLNIGERVKVYVEDVLEESKDAQIIVSNGSKEMIKRVLEVEVPEIAEGIVEIVTISRMPGIRAKVSVKTNVEGVDAVGALIGSNGTRIKAIIAKLDGEKLDIIPWIEDKNSFIASAMAPAKVIGIVDKKDADGKVIEGHKVVITPNKHQTLAIGKRGSNARLAVELTSTRLDIVSIDEAKEKGIEFEWNGNLTEAEVAIIESGERLNSRGGGQRPQRTFGSSVKLDSLDGDIQNFTEDMEAFDDEAGAAIQATEDMFADIDFSKDELDEIQEDFEFNEELADIDPDFLND